MKFLREELVSIITIVLNGEKYIEQTILSVISQQNVNIEYIVIDGGSTDGTLKIIEKYKNRIDFIISEADSGIYDAINKGIRLSNGELIGIIHCGDYYLPNMISKVHKEYLITKADIIYGNLIFIEEKESIEYESKGIPDHNNLRSKMSIFHPSTFVSNECYELNGYYDISFKIAADYALFLKNFVNGSRFSKINEDIAAFRSGGLSSTNSKKILKELFLIQSQHLGRFKAGLHILGRIIKNNYYLLRRELITVSIGEKCYEKLKFNQQKYLK
jgi:glycosyltransferase involved in cell wall biosynthesis